MFHFSVESKYVSDVDLNELVREGIVFDEAFQQHAMKTIMENSERYGVNPNDAVDVLDEMVIEGFFTVKEFSPTTLEEALELIKKYFFHPPQLHLV